MEIKRVAVTDSQQALGILKEAALWLQDIGSSQWAEVLQGEDKHGLANAVENGDVYYYFDKEQLVGLFAAWKKPTTWDQFLWGNQTQIKDAYYIHRIVIRPTYKGKGYGNKLLRDIKAYFKKDAEVLRLDCLASNQKLISFYNKNEFEKVATTKNQEGTLFELFSCDLA